LRQKIAFLSDDIASLDEPSDEDLQAYLTAQPERFRKETRFSFRQVYLNAKKRGKTADADALALLAELREHGGDAAEVGDRLMVQHYFENEPEREVSRALGSQFLEALIECPTGSWQGPIVSGFGLHLVYISERIEGSVPELDEVRETVLREWSAEARKKANEAFYEMLRERYTVTIVRPVTTDSSQVALAEPQE